MSQTRLFHKFVRNIIATPLLFDIFRGIQTNVVLSRKFEYIFKKSVRLAQKNMFDSCKTNLLSPPECIRGMKILDKEQFRKNVKVPVIILGDVVVSKVLPCVKKYLLKLENLKPLQTIDDQKCVLLNPMFVENFGDIESEELKTVGISESSFKIVDYELNYDHWKPDEILKCILPEDKDSVAGFSKIGHIIHLNLRDHVLDYKTIIGQILIEKIKGARTVVNKLDKIDSTYRNFEMEVLCGAEEFQVQVKENCCTFEFDFSTVYWNPRLSTEHERITDRLQPGDVLYDVFAGVGPFSIPAAKKKCYVLANDLNPESYKWLRHNVKINKIKDEYLKVFNKDGRDFIVNEIKMDLPRQLSKKRNVHIAMNLPAMATEFLDAFRGLLNATDFNNDTDTCLPIVHVYCFAKGENPVEIAKNLTETGLGCKLSNNLVEIFSVRKVSSYKEMMRVSFRLSRENLLGAKRKCEGKMRSSKKSNGNFIVQGFFFLITFCSSVPWGRTRGR